ncbi:MAG: carboxylate--amine ligase [Deltaproteobacteria bacterium]|nr:carboxylate--amine ligase [Deltaproteobacteria bacterium]
MLARDIEKDGGARSLSEAESMAILEEFGIPLVGQRKVRDLDDALKAASDLGYPVVLKACAEGLAHKTDKGLVRLHLNDESDLSAAFDDLVGKHHGEFIIQEQLEGAREIMVGGIRDPQFGPCVSFGIGGVMTELLDDVVFRVAPVSRVEAGEMLEDIRGNRILDTFRGESAIDRDILVGTIIGLSDLMVQRGDIREVDINPMIVRRDGRPVAVDALIIVATQAEQAKHV